MHETRSYKRLPRSGRSPTRDRRVGTASPSTSAEDSGQPLRILAAGVLLLVGSVGASAEREILLSSVLWDEETVAEEAEWRGDLDEALLRAPDFVAKLDVLTEVLATVSRELNRKRHDMNEEAHHIDRDDANEVARAALTFRKLGFALGCRFLHVAATQERVIEASEREIAEAEDNATSGAAFWRLRSHRRDAERNLAQMKEDATSLVFDVVQATVDDYEQYERRVAEVMRDK